VKIIHSVVKRPAKAAAKGRRGPKQNEWDDSEAVDGLMAKLDRPLRAQMEAVRCVLLSADRRITEGIKWNAPSCYCHEWFATFNRSPRAKDLVQVIFHRGAKAKPVGNSRYVDDPSGILEWITNDRCIAKFHGMKGIDTKRDALRDVVAQWVRKLSDEAKSA
jgi:hypothetical protein